MRLLQFLLIAALLLASNLYAWKTHDGDHPTPKKVKQNTNGIPDDAIVLFDGSSAKEWQHNNGSAIKWLIEGGSLLVHPGSGDIATKTSFGDIQLHLEWKSPRSKKDGQNSGNSGIFLMGRYEVQIIGAKAHGTTYSDGLAGAVYGDLPPLVAAETDDWNSYDIVFKVPVFDESGKLLRKAKITVLLNQVVVQNNEDISGQVYWFGRKRYSKHGNGPIVLQDHGETVSYRNIWVRELKRPVYQEVKKKPPAKVMDYKHLLGTYKGSADLGFEVICDVKDEGNVLGLSCLDGLTVDQLVPSEKGKVFELFHTDAQIEFSKESSPRKLIFSMHETRLELIRK